MVIGICRLAIELPGSLSLKEKRGPLRSIITRVRSTFNAAIAEVDRQDDHQAAVLGVAVVSTDERHANEMLSKVVAFVDENLKDGVLADYELEFIHV